MKLRWTRAARRDREFIYAYIEADDRGAALALDERFRERASQLTQLPHLGREGRMAGARELSVVGSSYVLVYRLDDDLVWIVRVIHTARAWPDEPE